MMQIITHFHQNARGKASTCNVVLLRESSNTEYCDLYA